MAGPVARSGILDFDKQITERDSSGRYQSNHDRINAGAWRVALFRQPLFSGCASVALFMDE